MRVFSTWWRNEIIYGVIDHEGKYWYSHANLKTVALELNYGWQDVEEGSPSMRKYPRGKGGGEFFFVDEVTAFDTFFYAERMYDFSERNDIWKGLKNTLVMQRKIYPDSCLDIIAVLEQSMGRKMRDTSWCDFVHYENDDNERKYKDMLKKERGEDVSGTSQIDKINEALKSGKGSVQVDGSGNVV